MLWPGETCTFIVSTVGKVLHYQDRRGFVCPYFITYILYELSLIEFVPDDWEQLVMSCGEVCTMAVRGWCNLDVAPPKSAITWVQCGQCGGWMHCICAGVSKKILESHTFSCCKTVDPLSEDNFRF